MTEPNQNFLKELEQIFFHFLVWNGKRGTIKCSTLFQNYEDGGLRMVDIYSFIKGLRLNWFYTKGICLVKHVNETDITMDSHD
jgi:hypothetical protein